jgi:lipopolysaccharide export system protein LptA
MRPARLPSLALAALLPLALAGQNAEDSPRPARSFEGHDPSRLPAREAPAGAPATTPAPEDAEPLGPSPEADETTTITSDGGFEMSSSATQNRFVFTDNVRIRAGGFFARCDTMTVVANRAGGDPRATVGQFGQIETVIAEGNVIIRQAGREAFCGRAEIYPLKGLAYLKQDPIVVDGETRITGYEMILDRNKESVRVLPYPEKGAEARIPEALTTGALPSAEDKPGEEEPD